MVENMSELLLNLVYTHLLSYLNLQSELDLDFAHLSIFMSCHQGIQLVIKYKYSY